MNEHLASTTTSHDDRRLGGLVTEWLGAEHTAGRRPFGAAARRAEAAAERVLPALLAAVPVALTPSESASRKSRSSKARSSESRSSESYSSDFADRVMARLTAPLHLSMPLPTPRAMSLDLTPRARLLVALALGLTGLTIAVLAPWTLDSALATDVGGLMLAVTLALSDAVGFALQAVGMLSGLVQVLVRLARVLVLRATSPEVLLALILCSGCALLLLRALHALLRPSSGRFAHVA